MGPPGMMGMTGSTGPPGENVSFFFSSVMLGLIMDNHLGNEWNRRFPWIEGNPRATRV